MEPFDRQAQRVCQGAKGSGEHLVHRLGWKHWIYPRLGALLVSQAQLQSVNLLMMSSSVTTRRVLSFEEDVWASCNTVHYCALRLPLRLS